MPTKTQKKAKPGGREVLKSLPSSRPHTRSSKRSAKGTTQRKTKAASARTTTRKPAARKASTTRRKPSSARRKSPATKVSAAPKSTTTTTNGAQVNPIELATTVVQRANELAQVSVSIGTAVVKGVLSRVQR